MFLCVAAYNSRNCTQYLSTELNQNQTSRPTGWKFALSILVSIYIHIHSSFFLFNQMFISMCLWNVEFFMHFLATVLSSTVDFIHIYMYKGVFSKTILKKWKYAYGNFIFSKKEENAKGDEKMWNFPLQSGVQKFHPKIISMLSINYDSEACLSEFIHTNPTGIISCSRATLDFKQRATKCTLAIDLIPTSY